MQRIVEHIQFGISAIVSSLSSHQAPASKLFHSDSAVDLCTVVQGAAVRLLIDCNAVLYLLGGWNAGESLIEFGL